MAPESSADDGRGPSRMTYFGRGPGEHLGGFLRDVAGAARPERGHGRVDLFVSNVIDGSTEGGWRDSLELYRDLRPAAGLGGR